MKLNIKIRPCKDYTSPFNCGIAKGLRRLGIFAVIGPTRFGGLFLFVIPVWGSIPTEVDDIAYTSTNPGFVPTKVSLKLYS